MLRHVQYHHDNHVNSELYSEISRNTRHPPALELCWATVVDGGPTLIQLCVNAFYLAGYAATLIPLVDTNPAVSQGEGMGG